MPYRVTCCLLAVLVSMASVATADPPVYISNGERIIKLDPGVLCAPGEIDYPACAAVLLQQDGASFEGLNFGPDGMLYWFDPANGRIGRTDPGAPVYATVYDASVTTGPAAPRGGWFTDKGDLLVTDQAGSGLWMFAGLAGGTPSAPVLLLGPADVGANGLDGVTQYLDGDALLVGLPAGRRGRGQIYRSDYPGFLPGGFPPITATLVGNVTASSVAVSQGYIFAGVGKSLKRYDTLGTSKACATSFSRDITALAGRGAGSLFVAAPSNQAALLYRISISPAGGCGAAVLLAELKKSDGFAAAIGGIATEPEPVAIPMTFDGTYEFIFNRANIFELTAGSAGDQCTTTMTWTLTPPATVQAWADEIEGFDPNDPGNPVSAAVVPALGNNGFVSVWELCTTLADGCNCPPAADGFYRSLVSEYYPPVGNARLGVCNEVDPAATDCELWTLTANIPFDPALAPVDPVGGRRGTGSHSFPLDVRTAAIGDANQPGVFCGWESPLTNTAAGDPPAVFDLGGTVPAKFRLAALVDHDNDPATPPVYNCQNGPYVVNAQALLSVAQLDPFRVLFVRSNGAGSEDPAKFEKPLNPNQQYHYNWDTTGLAAGRYLLTATFLTDNTVVQLTEAILQTP